MAKHERSAGAIVYYYDKEKGSVFLFLQNTLKKTYWEFPKGKIEDGESVESTVRREVKEETNLDKIEIIPGFKQTIQWYFTLQGEIIRKEATYVIARIDFKDRSKVKISKEHQKFDWFVFPDALAEMNIKANKEILQKANDFIKNFEKQRKLS